MNLTTIKSRVDSVFNLNIKLRNRKRNYIAARAIYFRLCRNLTPLSLYDIGKSLNMDHSSVLHALRHTYPSFVFSNLKEYTTIYEELYEELKSPETIPVDYKAKYKRERAKNRRLLYKLNSFSQRNLLSYNHKKRRLSNIY